jgi:TolB-like protein/tetratricopeptide (TPR) repeat protein
MTEGDGEKAGGSTPDVFISYASPDVVIADTACEALEKAGVRCWIAPRDVTPGAFYGDEIVHAIDAAKVIVLILSQNAATSPHVLREVERAASKRHAIISLRVDKAPLPAGLEYFLNTTQWLDASSGDTIRVLPKLVSAVQIAIQAPLMTPTGIPAAQAAAPALAARSPKRMALIGASVVGLSLVTFAAERLWLSGHRAAATPAATSVPSAPVVPAIPENSLAVLPFVDMSENHDQEYFSDGLSEELIDLLTKVPDLRVPARTSSFFFKGKSQDIAAIAQQLRVAQVLEGSVRKAAGTIRVTAQLIRADTGYHLWSQTYDRDLKDVFKVQDEIAGAVVAALKLKLESGQRVPGSHRTSKPEAYDQYLLGRQSFERGTPEGFQHAAQFFRTATEIDPGYAAAYAELALSQFYEADSRDEEQQALVAANKVVELAPEEAHGYAVRAFLRLKVNWDWPGAQADFEKALALDSANTRVQLGYAQLLATFGRLPEAIAATKKATELDPLSIEAWSDLCLYLAENQQFETGHEAARRALEIRPDMPYSLSWLGELQLLEGNAAAALASFRRVDIAVFRLWGVAMAEHTLGHAPESQQALEELIAKFARSAPYEVADVYAWRGETQKSFEWLEKSHELRADDLVDLKHDPLLLSLRGDPRFKALLRKMNLPE